MTTKLVTVTPDMASKWLTMNTTNRNLSGALVRKYASDIVAGRWGKTHQGIAFDSDGNLLDGQHRLSAIIEADTPVELLVTQGLPESARRHIDIGRKRSLVDIWRMENTFPLVGNTSLLHGVARKMFVGMRLTGGSVNPSDDALTEFVRTHEQALAFAVNHFSANARQKGIAIAGVVAATARAYYHVDHARLREFMDVMTTGVSLGLGDSAAVCLRNWLLASMNSLGKGTVTAPAYPKAEAAILHFIAGRHIKSLKFVESEQFPLPQEQKIRKAA